MEPFNHTINVPHCGQFIVITKLFDFTNIYLNRSSKQSVICNFAFNTNYEMDSYYQTYSRIAGRIIMMVKPETLFTSQLFPNLTIIDNDQKLFLYYSTMKWRHSLYIPNRHLSYSACLILYYAG